MRKATAVFAVITILLTTLTPSAFAVRDDISSHSTIVMCADTGDVLYEDDADERMLIASLTKIMTAILVIENCDLDELVIINPDWCYVEGSSMYLAAGKMYTVHDILMGMMLTSGNDAATALACHCSGSIEGFAKLMNEKAAELGMHNSSFKNPHGLDAEEHYSTARDLATLTRYCMKNEEFCKIVSTKSYTVGELSYINHNRLLWECEGCIGVKTGYTMASGRTLVSCAERNGMRLICVTLGAPDDWNDHMKLYDEAFAKYSLTVYDSDSFYANIPAVLPTFGKIKAVPQEKISVLTDGNDVVSIRLELPRLVFAPILNGGYAGKLTVFINGTLAAETNMVYAVPEAKIGTDK